MKNLHLMFCLSALGLAAIPAAAQNDTATYPATNLEKLLPVEEPRWEGTLNSAYVGGTKAKFNGTDEGNSGAYNVNLEAGTRVALSTNWSVNLGITSENLFLNPLSATPIPNQINTFRFNAGVGYRWDEQWTITGILSPSLYRFDEVRGDDFGLSGGVMVAYVARPSLIWSFGLLATPDSDIPVFPLVGVRWKIDERSLLEVGVPRTRYTYELLPKLGVYGGLDVNGTTFRTGSHFGDGLGQSQYNHALATYRDIRVGVGASYEFVRGLRAELETGASVYREINYTRIDNKVKFNPGPYVRLGLAVRF